jgi:hypothetical protein
MFAGNSWTIGVNLGLKPLLDLELQRQPLTDEGFDR